MPVSWSTCYGMRLMESQRKEDEMRTKREQLGLPLSGGGPTNPGYPTIFRPLVPVEPKPRGKPRAVLTTPRARWLIQLYKGPLSSVHGKVQQDCMAVGWTEWVKDAAGNYEEQLTAEGRRVIAHLFPTKKVRGS